MSDLNQGGATDTDHLGMFCRYLEWTTLSLWNRIRGDGHPGRLRWTRYKDRIVIRLESSPGAQTRSSKRRKK